MKKFKNMHKRLIKILYLLPMAVVILVAVSACNNKPSVSAEFVAVTDAGEFNSLQYKGDVIYLDFWASWCVPCRESFPWMNDMLAKYGDQGLQVIGVSLDQDKNLAKQFAEEFDAKFIVGYDVDGTLANQFEVKGLPSSVLIDRKGNLIVAHTGFNQEQAVEYEESLRKALK